MSNAARSIIKDDIFAGPYFLSIAGKLVAAEQGLNVFNPATGKVLARAPAATPVQLDEAVAAARIAFKSWSTSWRGFWCRSRASR